MLPETSLGGVPSHANERESVGTNITGLLTTVVFRLHSMRSLVALLLPQTSSLKTKVLKCCMRSRRLR